ncbi:hypothetical protein HH308_13395 [Gordonia sp. TBRC 11910]|uniref:Uncharacterized protein n=1 Tax=Gordonia asplenii TaxID=2725283 RepID=A0A848KVX0_9ACTN|nr:hypothetical protein [Gordonia asplenii]NMO02207.1 hypothetical protein [Gordonia asplenii]
MNTAFKRALAGGLLAMAAVAVGGPAEASAHGYSYHYYYFRPDYPTHQNIVGLSTPNPSKGDCKPFCGDIRLKPAF